MILSPLNLISHRLKPMSRSKPRYMPQPSQLTYWVFLSILNLNPLKDTCLGPGR
jgi:hypothetical protein